MQPTENPNQHLALETPKDDGLIAPLGAIVVDATADIDLLSNRVETVNNGVELRWEQHYGLNYLPGNKLITELPTSVFGTRKTSEGNQPDRINILPTAFDDLADGDYRISDSYSNVTIHILHRNGGTFFSMRPTAEDQTLEKELETAARTDESNHQAQLVSAQEGESYLDDAMSYYQNLRIEEGELPLTLQLLKKFGYPEVEIEGSKILLVPTPTTMKNMSVAQNVPLRFIDETLDGNMKIFYNAIPPEKYNGSIKDGFSPIGTRDLSYYGHDTETGHLPAILLCGRDLLDIYSPHIVPADEFFSSQTDILDDMTATISSAMESASRGEIGLTRLGQLEHDYSRLYSVGSDEREEDPYVMRKFFAGKLRLLADKGELSRLTSQGLADLEEFLRQAAA